MLIESAVGLFLADKRGEDGDEVTVGVGLGSVNAVDARWKELSREAAASLGINGCRAGARLAGSINGLREVESEQGTEGSTKPTAPLGLSHRPSARSRFLHFALQTKYAQIE